MTFRNRPTTDTLLMSACLSLYNSLTTLQDHNQIYEDVDLEERINLAVSKIDNHIELLILGKNDD